MHSPYLNANMITTRPFALCLNPSFGPLPLGDGFQELEVMPVVNHQRLFKVAQVFGVFLGLVKEDKCG